MIDKGYIINILARFEGRAIARGYIPCTRGTYYGTGPDKGEPLGASGVTIATGVDLGQQTRKGLESMGISLEILEILEPYIGLQKKTAIEKLRKDPLTLTAAQVEEIDTAVHERYINETADLFGRGGFEKAPKQVQAAAVSLHYQFGTLSREASPALAKAWELMRQGAYKAAAGALRDLSGWSKSHQTYMSRRRAEAALLDEARAV
jgi:GH24 family phage-related lysozyme (muramidase)